MGPAQPLPTGEIVAALGRFAGLPTVELEHPERLAQALEWSADGMDFADTLHLAAAARCTGLVSFDRRFCNMARRHATIRMRAP